MAKVRIYTTAPVDYDWGWTKILIDNVAITDRQKIFRLVEVDDEYHAQMQAGRYHSGMYHAYGEQEFNDFITAKFNTKFQAVTLTPDLEVHYFRTSFEIFPFLDTATEEETQALYNLIRSIQDTKQLPGNCGVALESRGHRYDLTVWGNKESAEDKFKELISMWYAITKEAKDANLQTEVEGAETSENS